MPEGPELHLASRLINSVCSNRIFTGKVVKSEVSTKNPDIPWNEDSYIISSIARGKEVIVNLTTISEKTSKKQKSRSVNILFRFGMSGKFSFDPVDEMKKHAHLNFFTKQEGMVLSFVDYRRFGRWELTSDWGKERGPCLITEYELFRKNVLGNLKDKAFNRPICEAMLNQKFFNGIGNYLRAEILFRCKIPPFSCARTVLENLVTKKEDHIKVKQEIPDILELCHLLPLEVVNLSGNTGFEVDPAEAKDASEFSNWLQCYYNPSMKNLVDHNSRTIWFTGPAGPMVPTTGKSRKRKEKTHLDKPSESTDEKPKKAKESKKFEGKLEKTTKKEVLNENHEKTRRLTRRAVKEEANNGISERPTAKINGRENSVKQEMDSKGAPNMINTKVKKEVLDDVDGDAKIKRTRKSVAKQSNLESKRCSEMQSKKRRTKRK